MGWNDSGDKNEKDPWGGSNKRQNPPDLDQIFRNFQKKISGKLGNGSNDGDNSSSGDGMHAGFLAGIIAAILLLIWAAFGFFIVGEPQRAVILRFGKYIETVGPGAHWIPPLIDRAFKVNQEKIYSYEYSDRMLTKDENIIDIAVKVQYRVGNAKDFLFNVAQPIQSLQEATASSLRQVVGNSDFDYIITDGRDEVGISVGQQLKETLTKYHTGLQVTAVKLQSASPPEEVRDAVEDVIKAREDKVRYEDQAHAYALQVTWNARGQADRLAASAQAYEQKVVLNAQGEVARFLALLPEYHKAPQVTRERLYLSAIEGVLNSTTKVLVDVSKSNNMLYLPLDQLMQQGRNSVLTNKSADKMTAMPLAAMNQHINQVEQSTTTSSSTSTTSTNNTGYYGTNNRYFDQKQGDK